MNRYVFLIGIFFKHSTLFLVFISGNFLFSLCDITDVISKQVSNEALAVWSLLELAEHEHITDHALFYDELCQATLKLCKEVQQLKESGYQLAERQINCFGQLFNHLHTRFRALPEFFEKDPRYTHAIDVILEYTNYFLKNDLSVDANGETAHPRL